MPVSVSIIITAALLFYSIGVWAEKIVGKLKVWHLICFATGLACDTIGTGMMFDFAGGLTFDIHGISGSIAIILMLIHALWALIVLVKNNEKMIGKFHRFSIFVWSIWLIPYFSPMFFAIAERGR
jgi:uncharacterized repeat protein (TIGR03987 family)